MSTSCFKGAGCQFPGFAALMPDRVTTLSGSCVTVPCSFTLADKFKAKLTSGCISKWMKDIYFKQYNNTILRGNLTEYNCTTTFNVLNVQDGGPYYFRIECPNLKYSFGISPVIIQVKGKCNVCVSETNMHHKSYWSYCGSNDADCW